MNYVPGLDGLRAVAVIAVLLFHAEFSFASGGFLGVSLFFTLSGFLITTLLLAEHEESGAISLRRFYARRARRLLPAAYACLVLVIAWSAWWAAGQQRALAGDVVAAVANVANWRFAFASSGYEDLFLGESSPVAHFWSLAIEEQIYLVLPVVVLLALRRGRRTLAVTTGALLVASIAATLLTSDRNLIYNGTHTRAAELLIGVALAMVLRHRGVPATGWAAGSVPVWRRSAIGVAASIALVVMFATATVQQNWIYGGGLVGVAVVSAALIAAIVDGRFPTALLEASALVAIGKVSYGLYLFHWPVFLLLDEARTGLGRLPLFAVQCLVTGLLTVASYRLIEQPVRRGRVGARNQVLVPAMAASALAVAGAAVLVVPSPALTETEQLLALGEQRVVDFGARSETDGAARSRVDQSSAGGGLSDAPDGVQAGAGPDDAGSDSSAVPDPAVLAAVARPDPPLRVVVIGSDRPTVDALRGADRRGEFDIVDDVREQCPLSHAQAAGCPPLVDRWHDLGGVDGADAAGEAGDGAGDGAADPDVLVLVSNQAEVDDVLASRMTAVSDDGLIALGARDEAAIAAVLATIDAALAAGVDVVWHTRAQPQTAYYRMYSRISVQQPDALAVSGGTTSLADTLRSIAAERVDAPGPGADGDDPLRLLVIGDSTSLNFARALNDGSDGRLRVLWAGANGCPFAAVEATRGRSDAEWSLPGCEPWQTKVPPLLASFAPDALLVMTGPMELSEHRFAGDPTGRIAGDPVFAAARETALGELLAVVPPSLPLLVADLPAIMEGRFSGPEMTSPERLAAVNAQISEWDRREPQLSVFPYRDTLEAAEARRAPDNPIRGDGTHPEVEALVELARSSYVSDLIERVGSVRSELAAVGS